ncbi:hypothetical protein GCM10023091_05840 [Ravibacter arvi]|uniref:Uncharacterized protein n=2 Tax=Ravibacter arvi TaxID=2051041 RepID=A0ABP8LQ05_9BACT
MAPAVIWLAVIAVFSVDIPWFDDFDPFADFLRKWTRAGSLSEKTRLLFQPNNEHRMVPAKLLTLLYFWISGKLNFVFLQACGACFTLATFWLLYRMFRKLNLASIYFLPVSLLLFQFQFYLIFLWSICSLQHQTSVFFMVAAMYLLANRKFSWAIAAAFCANYSFGSGMFVWPAGFIVLLLRHDWKPLVIWSLAGATGIFFYLHGMPAQGNDSGIAYFIEHPYMPLLGIPAFLGGLFDLFAKSNPITFRTALPVAAGTAMIGFALAWYSGLVLPFLQTYLKGLIKIPAVVLRIKKQLETDRVYTDFVTGILSFSFVNGIIIGFLRPRFGFDVLMVSNYKLYPALFMIGCYLALLALRLKRPVFLSTFRAITVVSAAIWLLSAFYQLPHIAERRKYLLINAYNQEHNAFGLGFEKGSAAGKYTDTLVKDLARADIYHFPDTYAGYFELMKTTQAVFDSQAVSLRTESDQVNFHLFLENSPYKLRFNDGFYAFVRHNGEIELFKFEQSAYQGKNRLRQFERVKHTALPLDLVKNRAAQIGILQLEAGKVTCGLISDEAVKQALNKDVNENSIFAKK